MLSVGFVIDDLRAIGYRNPLGQLELYSGSIHARKDTTMSDALTYLVKARPEAMGRTSASSRIAGTRLDPKTRNLISVITKVYAQTENGLRQYLTRALREGATADEVLDALLMAFPALGLAKIVWAWT